MKRLKASKTPKPVKHSFSASSALLPRDFVSYQEHFNNIYTTLLDNSLNNILSLIKPGIAYKGIPFGVVLLDLEYDENDFYVNVKSLIPSEDDFSFDREYSINYGFHEIFSAMRYFLNGIPYREGEVELLDWDSLVNINKSLIQLFDGLSDNRPNYSKSYYFYYGNVEFHYMIASKEEAQIRRYTNDISSIKLMGEDPFGYGGNFILKSSIDYDEYDFDDDSQAKEWNNYLHKEGYLIEKRRHRMFY